MYIFRIHMVTLNVVVASVSQQTCALRVPQVLLAPHELSDFKFDPEDSEEWLAVHRPGAPCLFALATKSSGLKLEPLMVCNISTT